MRGNRFGSLNHSRHKAHVPLIRNLLFFASAHRTAKALTAAHQFVGPLEFDVHSKQLTCSVPIPPLTAHPGPWLRAGKPVGFHSFFSPILDAVSDYITFSLRLTKGTRRFQPSPKQPRSKVSALILFPEVQSGRDYLNGERSTHSWEC